MKRLAVLVRAFLLVLPLACLGAEDGLSTRIEALSFRSSTDTWARSPFQRIATQPDHVWNTELRPDLVWQDEEFSSTLRPRLALAAAPGEAHAESWLNEGWLRWRPREGLSLQGGREVLLWGPAMFWNPSNPFFTDNNKANPKREIAGKDFLRTRWQLDRNFAITGISQLGRGHRASGTQRMDALKLDWVGEDASAAAIVAATPGASASWQGWVQWTATDAMLVYGELAWREGKTVSMPYESSGPTGWQVRNQPGRRSVLGVIGAAYTFDNDWTLHAELWRNGSGLNNAEAAQLGRATAALGTQPRGLADPQLGELISEPAPLRRHYLGLQLGNGDSAGVSWKLRLTRNLDDESIEGVAMLDYDLNDSLKLWLNLMRRNGRAESEYGRWARGSSMLGVTWYAW
ncbi:MAG: hypothetical protein H6R19_849 [Proteobacteria bacterium]|nr:hypothetical protein [Pseudomonadota bacterium]